MIFTEELLNGCIENSTMHLVVDGYKLNARKKLLELFGSYSTYFLFVGPVSFLKKFFAFSGFRFTITLYICHSFV